jgi:hypothetical protein
LNTQVGHSTEQTRGKDEAPKLALFVHMGTAPGPASPRQREIRKLGLFYTAPDSINDRHNPFDLKSLASIWTIRQLALFDANSHDADAEGPGAAVGRSQNHLAPGRGGAEINRTTPVFPTRRPGVSARESKI